MQIFYANSSHTVRSESGGPGSVDCSTATFTALFYFRKTPKTKVNRPQWQINSDICSHRETIKPDERATERRRERITAINKNKKRRSFQQQLHMMSCHITNTLTNISTQQNKHQSSKLQLSEASWWIKGQRSRSLWHQQNTVILLIIGTQMWSDDGCVWCFRWWKVKG